MRETFKLMLSAIAVIILMVSCDAGYKNVKLSSFTLKEISVTGLRSVCGVAEVGVHNPAEQFRISDVALCLKTLEGEQVVNVVSEGFSVSARCDSAYAVGFEASLPQSITPMWLIGNLNSLDADRFRLDVSMKFVTRSRIGTTLSYKDVPLENLRILK